MSKICANLSEKWIKWRTEILPVLQVPIAQYTHRYTNMVAHYHGAHYHSWGVHYHLIMVIVHTIIVRVHTVMVRVKQSQS